MRVGHFGPTRLRAALVRRESSASERLSERLVRSRKRIACVHSRLRLAQVVAMSFGAVAARLHRTPTARAILALVEKYPEASIIGTVANAREARADQQVGGRPEHRG